jgi:hypothetical protein
MPKENDLEGRQDQGGKHGGQAGQPQPERVASGAPVGPRTDGPKGEVEGDPRVPDAGTRSG